MCIRSPAYSEDGTALFLEEVERRKADIVAGAVFPDYELTDHTGKRRKLSDLQGPDPVILVLSRGGYFATGWLSPLRLFQRSKLRYRIFEFRNMRWTEISGLYDGSQRRGLIPPGGHCHVASSVSLRFRIMRTTVSSPGAVLSIAW